MKIITISIICKTKRRANLNQKMNSLFKKYLELIEK